MRYQNKFDQMYETWVQLKKYYDENPESSGMKVQAVASKAYGEHVIEDYSTFEDESINISHMRR